MAAVDESCARIAQQFLPPETFSDPILKDLAARLYAQLGTEAFGLARLSDQLEDEDLKRRIAAWEFQVPDRPSEDEYTRLALGLRSRWLCQAIADAEEKSDAATVRRLRDEHFELRRKLLQNGN